ncbi:gamma-glutamyl-gamma-aminobutyraldehyde dehydrogenase/4-guanidinobutyraldehyde dehydrogenase/NAD-dependent aldehyde dehydrogenase [Murinocardiopsis flavida]|uniref:Gamma-glutamyl-gamma-aminobutyraldehyde dehydrogenase/4-guanidinobutyraldehyde dehydrogenase/NAD-dependent aldehyde dehydrogenase n=1 Tax=Murinocardiopsis flavida TaxID=645275 RepID=A0A2P8CZ20_9ACTN|nr:aldehyde dehydrogenase family protein [Murinocardiopsis flavida]PSK90203.1 gamma-glutamyl-gamma-aminobutyraldehyde dehydrogenase/4-guanidinobutyraldehyde dehydrogenase/NAD-dependent aldehyde dehydrogenase [Murinocardiopsis flavida]
MTDPRPATTLDHWRHRAALLTDSGPDSGLMIGGAPRAARSGAAFPSVSPRDGAEIARVAAAQPEDVEDAVRAARAAFDSGIWSRADPRHRQEVLHRLADLVEAHLDELALLESLDTGKPIADTVAVDVPSLARTLRWYAEAVDKVSGEVAPGPDSALVTVTREPLGVVGAVVPWNYPLIISGWKIAPALAVGNSVLLKPAEQSSLSAIRLAGLAAEAGIPPGVLAVLPGPGEVTGRALGLHGDVDKIAFTGSVPVGRMFQCYAGQSNGKQVALELGGKSPQLVLSDAADLDAVAESVAWGIFYNAGQTCHAGSRLVVHESLHDALVERVAAVAAAMAVGDPLDPATRIGPIVDERQYGAVLAHLDHAADTGVAAALGGAGAAAAAPGLCVPPTILTRVDPASHLGQEEVFGPVLTTHTFTTAEEGVRIANGTRFGLAAAVWTRDLATAHRVARRLRAGTVWVNTYDAADLITPFGGVKESGAGRDRSLGALESYTAAKTTWIDLGKE